MLRWFYLRSDFMRGLLLNVIVTNLSWIVVPSSNCLLLLGLGHHCCLIQFLLIDLVVVSGLNIVSLARVRVFLILILLILNSMV